MFRRHGHEEHEAARYKPASALMSIGTGTDLRSVLTCWIEFEGPDGADTNLQATQPMACIEANIFHFIPSGRSCACRRI